MTIISDGFLGSKTLNKIVPFLTARYIIQCTRRLQPTRDDCAVRVHWLSSVSTAANLICETVFTGQFIGQLKMLLYDETQ